MPLHQRNNTIFHLTFILTLCISSSLLAMDPTSLRSAHPERAQRVEGRRDTNRAISPRSSLGVAGAPEEQRRMDPRLLSALQKKDITALQKILKSPGIDVNAPHGAHANTPLHLAAQKLFVQGVSALIQARADVNAYNGLGKTPLSMVLGEKMMKLDTADKIGKILLEAGTHIKTPSNNLMNHDHPFFEEVIYAPLIRAIRDNNLQKIKQLLAQGADPNHFIIHTDGNSRRTNNQVIVPSLLNIATSCNNADAVCLLLDAGADPAKSTFIINPSMSQLLGYQPSTSNPICVLALSMGKPEMAQLLFTHVPQALIKNAWNTKGLQVLLVLSRLLNNRDLRLLICTHCVADAAFEKQHNVTQKISEQTRPYIPLLVQGAILDASNLPTYYPLWKEQIFYAIQMRPRPSQSTATNEACLSIE